MAAKCTSLAAMRRRVIVVCAVMAVVASGVWPGAGTPAAAAAAAADTTEPTLPEAQEVHTVWTSKYGVPRPQGLAYAPSRGELLVAGDDPDGTRILRLGADEDPRGSLLLPDLANPPTLAFDAAHDQLTAIDDGTRLEVAGPALTAARPPTDRVPIDGLALDAPASATFDAATGTWFVAEQDTDTIAVIAGDDVSTPPDRLALPPSAATRVIAFHPTDDLLYVLDPDAGRIDGVDRDGTVDTSFSLASLELSDPVAMAFAPSTDPTDDADSLNLYVADSGSDTTLGGVTEVSLTTTTTTTAAATVDTATLVQTIATSSWDPPSPDPAGIVWMPSVDELAVADSEVDETTGAGWHDVNLWRSTRTGTVVGVGTMWGPNSAGSFSKEPTGLGYDDATGRLFVSDDSAGAVFVVRRGSDGALGTSDDIVDTIDTDQYGLNDTEDPEYDPDTGHLFFLDGTGREIYRIDPVDGVFGNSNDIMSHFDISHLGPKDFEGLSSNPGHGTLLVGARTTEEIYEITFDGTLVRRIDVPVSELRFISGLGVAPASDNSGQTNLWIVDRAVDNGADPNENDGRIFEISVPNIGGPPPENTAPVIDSVTIDQSSPQTNDTLTVTVNASDADGDTLTYDYQWTRNGTDIPGATTATLDLSVDGNGDKGDAIAVRVTASDGTATSDPVTSSAVTVVNTAPAFDLADQTNTEGDTVNLDVAATDADNDTLTYSATGLPDGLTIDASTGLISGTIATGAAAASPYTVTVTVDDATTATNDTITWTVTAANPDNAAPVIDSVTIDQSSPQTNDTLTVTVNASDADGDTLTYDYQWTRNGTDIPGATTATLDLSVDGNGDKGDAIAVRVTASDGTATSDPVTSSAVTVVNTAPAFDLADQTNTEGDTVNLDVAATDADNDTLTYSATGLPDGLTIDASTGLISGTIATGAAAASPYTVTVTVDDATTATNDTITWTVTADPAPAAPTGLSATVTSVRVDLDWDDTTEPDLAGYHVYRSANETGPYERLTASPLSDSAYADDAAPQGTSYYRVTAVDTGGRESEPAAVSAARLILFRSANANATRNATSLSVPRPSGIAAGDVMVAAVGVRGAPTITAPSGWTLVRVDTDGSTMRQAVYTRTATSGEPSAYSWSFSARTASAGGLVVAYHGVDTASPIDASSGRANAESDAITAPSLSTTVTDTLLVGFFSIANNPSITEPPGMIEQAEVVQNAGKDKLSAATADEVLPASGGSGSRTATANQSGVNIGQLVALRPGQ